MLEMVPVSEDHLDTGAGLPFTRTLFRGSKFMEPIPDHNPPMSRAFSCCVFRILGGQIKTIRTTVSPGVRAAPAVNDHAWLNDQRGRYPAVFGPRYAKPTGPV